MTPREQSMLKTLNLVVMLARSKKQLTFGLPEEEKYILTITKQNLSDSDLTLPEFTNTLHALAQKGYIWHMVIHDENLRSQINDFKDSEKYDDVVSALKKLDTKELSDKINKESTQGFNSLIPKSIDFDYSDLTKEKLKPSELFNEGMEIFNKMRPDEIGLVLLMPFRDIEVLFNKLNMGKNFDDIQDNGFWYDQNKFQFHIDGKIIETSNRGLPNLSHFVLSSIFTKPNTTKIEYEEMIGFDPLKGNEPYRDAMRKFISKDTKLQQMFSVHLYHTEFNPDKYNEIP